MAKTKVEKAAKDAVPAVTEQESPATDPVAPVKEEAPKKKPGRKAAEPVPYGGPTLTTDDAPVQRVLLKELDLRDETLQIRFTSKPDEALVDSVKSIGIQIPIIVRPHPDNASEFRYQIVCGFRRANAALSLKHSEVPAQLRNLDDDQAQVMAWTENEFRKTLRDMDRAIAIDKMHRSGKKQSEIASILRLSTRQIQRLESLLNYPDELKAVLGDDNSGVSTTSALVLWQAKCKHGQAFDLVEWIGKASKIGSVDDLEKAIRKAFKQRRTINKLIRKSRGIVSFDLKALEAAPADERHAAISEVEALLSRLKGQRGDDAS